jgi:hypothetical protein
MGQDLLVRHSEDTRAGRDRLHAKKSILFTAGWQPLHQALAVGASDLPTYLYTARRQPPLPLRH